MEAVPAPTLNKISPPLPTVAAPDAIINVPDEPELVVPLENFKEPLIPAAPALLVRTITDPLDFVVPVPVDSEILPPDADPLLPAPAVISPPIPVEEVPTRISIFPAFPPVAAPDVN